MLRNLSPFCGQEEFGQLSNLFELCRSKHVFHHNVQKLKHHLRVLPHLGRLLVEAESHLVLDAEDELLALYRGVDVDLHVGLLHAENKVIVTNVRSKVTDNLIVGRPNRLSVGLPVLAKSAPVDAVNVNKTLVVDGQLEVIRHELTGLARSG